MRSVRERSIYGYHRSINALKPKFVIPVKTERSKLISVLPDGIFSKNNVNTVQIEILYFARPVLLMRRTFIIITRNPDRSIASTICAI